MHFLCMASLDMAFPISALLPGTELSFGFWVQLLRSSSFLSAAYGGRSSWKQGPGTCVRMSHYRGYKLLLSRNDTSTPDSGIHTVIRSHSDLL